MSYILGALRRADAERERDPARGIHAQPLAPAAARRVSPPSAWVWSGLVVAAAAAGAYAWWPRPPQPMPAANPVAGPAPVVLPVAVDVASAAATEPIPPAVAVAPIAPAVPVAPHPGAVRSAARSVHAAAPAAAATRASVLATATPPASAPVMAAPLAAAAAPAGRIYAVSELPPDVQRELPKLAISGGVYSDSAAQRMLIVGGQVMFEGNELAPGVVLERIRDRSAVLRFRGWRYSVGY